MRKYERQVAAGIALLDQKGPKGWRAKVLRAIKRGIFDMSRADCCALGCVFGYYSLGTRALGLPLDDVTCGFYISEKEDGVSHKYPALQREWLRQLGA